MLHNNHRSLEIDCFCQNTLSRTRKLKEGRPEERESVTDGSGVLTGKINIEVSAVNSGALLSCTRQTPRVRKSPENSKDGSDASKREHGLMRSRCEGVRRVTGSTYGDFTLI